MPNGPRDHIELHIRVLSQLFESLDPSPFHDQDLAREAEAWILETAKELPTKRPRALVIHVDEAVRDGSETLVGDAVRIHFVRRANGLRANVRELLRRGWISLCIGLSAFGALFALGHFLGARFGDANWVSLARESLVIGGWVAMWRPIEILLYDWWPIVAERHLAERLAAMDVRLVPSTRQRSAH